MKRIIIAALVLGSITSCNKKDDNVVPIDPDAPVLVKSSYSDKTIKPSSNMVIGVFNFKVGNMENFAIMPSFILSTTISFFNLRNFYFRILETDSTEVFRSITAVTQQELTYPDFIYDRLIKNSTYIVMCYADATAGTMGNVMVTMKTKYGWQDGYGTHTDWTSNVPGQTITISPNMATPSFNAESLPGVITDSTQTETYKHSATSPLNGATGYKQFAYGIVFGDSGSNDTLSLINLKFFENGVDVTNKVKFSNAAGAAITMLTESDTKLFVTYTAGIGESIVLAGATTEYVLEAMHAGFHHPNDGDGFNIQLLSDQNPVQQNFLYVNPGTTGVQAKLYSSVAPNGSAVVSNRIWTDFSAGTVHSGLFTLSSNDWKNSYGFPALPVQNWHQ